MRRRCLPASSPHFLIALSISGLGLGSALAVRACRTHLKTIRAGTVLVHVPANDAAQSVSAELQLEDLRGLAADLSSKRPRLLKTYTDRFARACI